MFSRLNKFSNKSFPNMSSLPKSNDNIIDERLLSNLKQVYEMIPQNLFSIFVTGGAAQSILALFSIPGASRSVIEAGIPYSRTSLQNFVGTKIFNEKEGLPCNPSTSKKISYAAFIKSVNLCLQENKDFQLLISCNIFGIGCTAALLSAVLKKGSHRCHVASSNSSITNIYSLEVEKGKRNRIEEDKVYSHLVIDLISNSCNLNAESLTSDLLFPDETIIKSTIDHGDVIDNLLNGNIGQAAFIPKYNVESSGLIEDDFAYFEDITLPNGTIIYPGSFNPLHEGHILLLLSALKTKGWEPSHSTCNPPIVFEIAAINVDKPPISRIEIHKRLKQFNNQTNQILRDSGITNFAICITSQPLFLGKSLLFPNCTYLIGADTMSRLIDPKYYAEKTTSLDAKDDNIINIVNMNIALSIISQRGCNFIVGGRVKKDNEFETLESILLDNSSNFLSSANKIMFQGISEADFRIDLSSTELRNKNK